MMSQYVGKPRIPRTKVVEIGDGRTRQSGARPPSLNVRQVCRYLLRPQIARSRRPATAPENAAVNGGRAEQRDELQNKRGGQQRKSDDGQRCGPNVLGGEGEQSGQEARRGSRRSSSLIRSSAAARHSFRDPTPRTRSVAAVARWRNVVKSVASVAVTN